MSKYQFSGLVRGLTVEQGNSTGGQVKITLQIAPAQNYIFQHGQDAFLLCAEVSNLIPATVVCPNRLQDNTATLSIEIPQPLNQVSVLQFNLLQTAYFNHSQVTLTFFAAAAAAPAGIDFWQRELFDKINDPNAQNNPIDPKILFSISTSNA